MTPTQRVRMTQSFELAGELRILFVTRMSFTAPAAKPGTPYETLYKAMENTYNHITAPKHHSINDLRPMQPPYSGP
jgi:hypothetical protein